MSRMFIRQGYKTLVRQTWVTTTATTTIITIGSTIYYYYFQRNKRPCPTLQQCCHDLSVAVTSILTPTQSGVLKGPVGHYTL